MEKISIFNYEAFYLDFLEGNLNEVDSALFLEFLEANPELKMESEELPVFHKSEINLDEITKSELKQPLFTDVISDVNIDYFLIAQMEGLLSEAKNEELELFIEGNEKLISDQRILKATFFEVDETVVYTNKEELKRNEELIQPLYTDVISGVNIDYFLIAQAEGLLNETKVEELELFIEGNQNLVTDQRILKAAFFEVDETIVYANKEELKRKKAIVLWPYFAAAASLLIALMVWNSSSNSTTSENTDPLFANETSKGVEQKEPILQDKEQKGTVPTAKDEILFAQDNNEEKTDELKALPNQKNVNQDDLIDRQNTIDKLKLQQVSLQKNSSPSILASVDNTHLKPITLDSQEETSSNANEDYASVYFSDAENPIEPITSFIGDKTNKEVDFRRQRKTKTQGKGFFVKVGKFEFSKTKHK